MTAITASAMGPGLEIGAIPLAPPRVSLLSSVDVTSDDRMLGDGNLLDARAAEADRALRWVNGIRFTPESCDPPDNPYWWSCPEGAGSAPGFQKTLPAPESIVINRPFNIWVGYRCSALQARQGEEFNARSRRAMEAFQSYLIARELWTGAYVTTPSGFPNDFFENSPTLLNGGGLTPYVTALAELEQALATCQPGQVSVIHAQPRTVTYWRAEGLVEAEPNGRRLRTLLGTIVVPDAGYDGGGTAQGDGDLGDAYAYGTGMVRVWLGPMYHQHSEGHPDHSDGQTWGLNDAEIERTQNTVNVRVERTAAAVWDECCQVGVRVNHTARL